MTRPELFLDRALLEVPEAARRQGVLGASLGAHGLYDPFQFVLRLSAVIHRTLDRLPVGLVSASQIDFAGAQAHSTYLHETIHWWQHIGSTFGFMLSLGFPAGLQANYQKLRQLLDQAGFKKSIRALAETAPEPSAPDTVAGLANIIVNNQFDFTALMRLAHSLKTRRAILSDPMFEGVGHTFSIAWGNNVLVLAATCGSDFQVFEHPEQWEPFFQFLRSSDAAKDFADNPFQSGAPVRCFPIGVYELMEGQARFGQMQYLHFGSGGMADWGEFGAAGMLGKPYIDAFDQFLALTQFAKPSSIDHPIVALFMLICDMALNPGAGFPFPVQFYAAFVGDIDPAERFDLLCRLVRIEHPHLASSIQGYTREEYKAASDALARSAKIDAPLAIAEAFAAWPTRSEAIAALMGEYDTFEYGALNFPIRLLFSHFLAFQRDKAQRPEVFCWPGAWMAGSRVSKAEADLFDRHGALFVDRADDDGVFPRIRQDRDEGAITTTFNRFYSAVVTYDMVEQWITRQGPFAYDYDWLTRAYDAHVVKAYADEAFVAAFGVHPDTAQLLDRA